MPKGRASKPSKRKSAAKLPKNAVTLIVILRAKPSQEGLLEAELRALISPTRRDEGCLTYELHRALDIPAAFLFHEAWATREQHRLHTKTAHLLPFDARTQPLLSSHH